SADCAVLCARGGLLEIARLVWEGLERGRGIAPLWRARMHAIADHATRTARDAVSRTFACGSVDVLHAGHPLEQALRDIHAFSVQWERYRRLHYEAGRVLLGGASQDPLF